MPDKISGESKTFLSPKDEVDVRRKVEILKTKIKKNATSPEEEMKTLIKKLYFKQGSAVEQWERELQRALDSQIERKPVVEDQNFTYVNPMKNPNPEIKSTANVTLRTSRDILFMDHVKLVRFDPSSMSPNEIRCRYPGCKEIKKRQPTSSRSTSKEDLYLCSSHRKLVENDVTMLCAAKGMDVSKKYCPEDFKRYISMIGLLERAYFHSLKSSPFRFANAVVTRRKTIITSEVFINLRNYLMITNALMNPEDENLLTALTRPMEVYLEILKILRNDRVQRLTELVVLLRDVIERILFAFGIIYSWVNIEDLNNDGAKVGAFVGGFFGMFGFAAGPEVGVFTTLFGSVFGGLFGSGVQNLVNRQRREQRQADEGLRRYRRYVERHRIQEQEDDDVDDADSGIFSITGSVHGDLDLNFLPLD